MGAATAHQCRLLPLLEDQAGYQDAMKVSEGSQSSQRDRVKASFYASRLNRANRVPANGRFSDGTSDNMIKVVACLKDTMEHAGGARKLERRRAKYASQKRGLSALLLILWSWSLCRYKAMIDSVPAVPEAGQWGDKKAQDHLQDLADVILAFEAPCLMPYQI